jgi:hypothetical protein
MMDQVETELMVHICTGCYGQAVNHLGEDGSREVIMLPELVERAIMNESR